MVRRKHVRKLALSLLSECDIDSAPVPVEDIASRLGVTVERASVSGDLSGLLLRDHVSGKSVIGVNSTQSILRQNFTIAHELGHFFLHDYEEVHVDRVFSVKLRSAKSSEGTDSEEKEANLFAAELLMPVHFLEHDLSEIEDLDLLEEEGVILELARKYKVSVQAMTFRLSYLGYMQL
jgi:Zn-dependent peptidase ImmA (M78 family)